MSKRRTSVSRKHQDKLLALLCDGLSEVELGRVMAGALLVMDALTTNRLVKLLGPDTGKTLQNILAAAQGNGADTARPEKRVGAGKVLQEWKQAWREWDDCVYESGREEGKYKYQEHHWEEPFIDMTAVSSDIDDIAARLRPLAVRVHANRLDPDFSMAVKFTQTIDEVGSGLPDHMDPSYGDPFSFDAEATRLLLEWECAESHRNGEPAPEFIRRVCEFTIQTKRLYLDDGAIIGFIRQLPKTERQAVTHEIRTHAGREPWKTAVQSRYATWSGVVKVLGGIGRVTKKGRVVVPVGKQR